MRESNEMRGSLTVQMTDQQGTLVYATQHKNRIVTSGRTLVAQLFAGIGGGVPPAQVTHMGVGTDATPPNDIDGALKAERAPRRAISSVDYSEISEGSGPSEVKRVRARLTAVFDFGDANGAEPLREALAPLSDRIHAAFLYGSIAKGSDTARSDIDLMVIADDLAYAEIMLALHPVAERLGRPINPTVYARDELRSRLDAGNSFVGRVLQQPRQWLIGGEDDLAT